MFKDLEEKLWQEFKTIKNSIGDVKKKMRAP